METKIFKQLIHSIGNLKKIPLNVIFDQDGKKIYPFNYEEICEFFHNNLSNNINNNNSSSSSSINESLNRTNDGNDLNIELNFYTWSGRVYMGVWVNVKKNPKLIMMINITHRTMYNVPMNHMWNFVSDVNTLQMDYICIFIRERFELYKNKNCVWN